MLALLVPGVGMGGGEVIVTVDGPYCVVAVAAYIPGARATSVQVAGANDKAVYVAGGQTKHAGCC